MNNNVLNIYNNNSYIYKKNNYKFVKMRQTLPKQTNLSFKGKTDKSFFTRLLDGFQSLPGISNYVNWCKNKWNKLDELFCSLADTKGMKKLINWASKKKSTIGNQMSNSEKLNQFFMIAFSACLQSCSIFNIARDKNIPKERKENLMVNTGLTFIIPTIGALFIDNIINKQFDKLVEQYKKVNKNNPKLTKESVELACKGIKNFKSIFVFAFMYKFGSTLIALPIADKVTDYMRKKGYFKPSNPSLDTQNIA